MSLTHESESNIMERERYEPAGPVDGEAIADNLLAKRNKASDTHDAQTVAPQATGDIISNAALLDAQRLEAPADNRNTARF